MSNQIVQVNVTQNVGATPSTLQRTGALISVGGTTTSPGTRTLLTQLADLTPVLSGVLPISSIVWGTVQSLSAIATGSDWIVGDTFHVAGGDGTAVGAVATILPLQYSASITAIFQGSTVAITALSQGSKTFSVGSDVTSSLQPTVKFIITGSTGNNGTYTVVSAVFGSGTTVITVVEAVPNATADGSIHLSAIITVGGNHAAAITASADVVVRASTGNNGKYVAVQRGLFVGGSTNIYLAPSATLPSATADGTFYTTGQVASITVTAVGSAYTSFTVETTTAISPSFGTGLTVNVSALLGALVTTVAPHGIPFSEQVVVTIAGVIPVGYNGTVTAMSTGVSTFTYTLLSNPGPETTPGTYIIASASELAQMATTFFAQGSSIGVYVLELGPVDVPTGIEFLATYIANNPGFFYAYLVPRSWDGSSILTLLSQFENTTSKTYFWITTTVGSYTDYQPTMKDAVTLIEAPSGLFATEFSMAGPFRVALNYNPSSTNKVTPLAFSYLFGETPYPTVGTAPLRQTLKTAGVNIVASGSEGGITNDILLWGTNMDTRPFNYWYSVDWAQINLELNVANAIINGSNNPINPLYLSQDGINRLQVVIARTMTTAIVVGLALGTVVQTELDGPAFDDALNAGTFAGQIVVNAVPFVAYYTANPGDFKLGIYNGFSVTYTPLRGFEGITINLNVSDFVAG